MRYRIRYLFLLLAIPLQLAAVDYTVSVTTNTCSEPQTYTIPEGEQMVLYAHPKTGYTFSQWSDGNTDNPRIVTIMDDVSYMAEFLATPVLTTHEVTVYAHGCTSKVIKVVEGEQMVLHAHSTKGYTFSQWSDGNTENPRIVTIDGDITFSAEFIAISSMPTTYNVMVYSEGCTPKAILVAEGEQMVLQAHPMAGHTFSQWSDGNTENPRILTVTSDASYAAEFVAMSPMPTTYDVTVYADGCTPKVIPVAEGEQILLNAHAKSGYSFSQWSDGNTDNPRMVTITEDATFRALFEVSTAPNPDGVYTFTVNAENCSTSLSPNFSQGTEVKLYAEPIDCNYFVRWSDGNTDNPRTVIVDGDATYTAEFSPNQYIISVLSDDDNQGTVSVEKN